MRETLRFGRYPSQSQIVGKSPPTNSETRTVLTLIPAAGEARAHAQPSVPTPPGHPPPPFRLRASGRHLGTQRPSVGLAAGGGVVAGRPGLGLPLRPFRLSPFARGPRPARRRGGPGLGGGPPPHDP